MSNQFEESSSSDNDSYRMLRESDCSSDQDEIDDSPSAWLDHEALKPFSQFDTRTNELSILCGACQSFFKGRKKAEIKYKHIQFLATLRDAAKRGCRLCALILGKVDRETANHYPADIPSIQLEIDKCSSEDESLFELWYYYRKGSKRPKYGKFVQGIKLIRFLPRKGVFIPEGNERCIGTNTWSTEARQVAWQWISECVTKHVQCNGRMTRDLWMPTRLLDIQGSNGSETEVFLVESKDINPKAQYASLSHCWGHAPFLTLRTESIEIFKKGLPVTCLTKTFQQAVEVARYLHMRYIWIDSLCIIQNSVADWQVESLTMMNVYQHAFCNIAATGSENSQGGLFFERDPSLVPVSTVSLQWNKTSWQGEYCFYPDTVWIDGVVSAPLNRRAWVVQERLLAKRVLHFGSQSLFFECCEHEACETFPKGLPQSHYSNNSVNQFKRIYERKKVPNNPMKNHRLWERVVQAFTRSSLSYASDKLVSIAGIAHEFQKIFKQKYIVGFWENGLEEQLLWLVLGERQANGSPSKRPLLYRAPSWSWLSIDAKVHLDEPSYRPTLIEITEVHIDLLDDSHPTGQITGGYLIVNCYLILATCGFRTSSDPNIPQDYLLFDGREIGTTQIHFDEACRKPIKDEPLFCLPISGSVDSHRWSGLVLMLTSNQQAEYQRIGLYKAADKDFSEYCANEKARLKKMIKLV